MIFQSILVAMLIAVGIGCAIVGVSSVIVGGRSDRR